MKIATRLTAAILILCGAIIQSASAQPPTAEEIRKNAEAAQKELSDETGGDDDDFDDMPTSPSSKKAKKDKSSETGEAPPAASKQTQPSTPDQAPVSRLPADSQDAKPKTKQKRDSFYVGFSFGLPVGEIGLGAGEQISFVDYLDPKEKSPRVAMEFEIGGTLTPQLLLGFSFSEYILFNELENTSPSEERVLENRHLLAVLTFFPMPNGKGLFVRG